MIKLLRQISAVMFTCALAPVATASDQGAAAIHPTGSGAVEVVDAVEEGVVAPQDVQRPRTRWEHRERHPRWNRGALQALRSHGSALVDMVPKDIAFWCPGYPAQDEERRRFFWVGFLSALAKYESTYRADAVGGGGRWYGLLQILPGTAQSYDCKASSGDELKNGAANLSCAVRIMAITVARDGVIQGKDGGWLGVSADWGPLRSGGKRNEMAEWLNAQRYCRLPDQERARVGSPEATSRTE